MYLYTSIQNNDILVLVNVHIIMKVSKKIRDRILTDNDFSLDVAKQLGIQQYSVKELAKRNSDKLANYHVVEFYKSKGFDIQEIFEIQKKDS